VEAVSEAVNLYDENGRLLYQPAVRLHGKSKVAAYTDDMIQVTRWADVESVDTFERTVTFRFSSDLITTQGLVTHYVIWNGGDETRRVRLDQPIRIIQGSVPITLIVADPLP
jgi:hypothetical protein